MLAPVPEPLSPVLHGRSLDRRLDVLELPLAGFQSAARLAGGTINDVFLAGLGGGFHDFHALLGHEVPALRITMPISLRSEGDPPGGNRFTPARFVLAIDDPDPIARTRLAGNIARRWRAEPAVGLTDVLAAVLARLPASVVTPLLGSMLKNVDIDAVDVPGLRAPAFVGGARIERMWAFAPPTGAAVSVTLLSHVDTACISVLSDLAAPTRPDPPGHVPRARVRRDRCLGRFERGGRFMNPDRLGAIDATYPRGRGTPRAAACRLDRDLRPRTAVRLRWQPSLGHHPAAIDTRLGPTPPTPPASGRGSPRNRPPGVGSTTKASTSPTMWTSFRYRHLATRRPCLQLGRGIGHAAARPQPAALAPSICHRPVRRPDRAHRARPSRHGRRGAGWGRVARSPRHVPRHPGRCRGSLAPATTPSPVSLLIDGAVDRITAPVAATVRAHALVPASSRCRPWDDGGRRLLGFPPPRRCEGATFFAQSTDRSGSSPRRHTPTDSRPCGTQASRPVPRSTTSCWRRSPEGCASSCWPEASPSRRTSS